MHGQLSVLRVFEQLLADASFRSRRSAPEVLRFAAGVVRNLLKRLANADAHAAAPAAARAAFDADSAGAPAPLPGIG